MAMRVWYPEDYYSASDLNRVSTEIISLETKIRGLEFPMPPSETLHNWTNSDLALITRINILRSRINRMYTIFYKPSGAPTINEDTTSIQVFDFADANDLELALHLLEGLVNALTDNYKYCGTFTCGEGDII